MTGPTPLLTDGQWALILAEALAWSVGRFEGMGVDPGYAATVLARWHNPTVYVDGVLRERAPERES